MTMEAKSSEENKNTMLLLEEGRKEPQAKACKNIHCLQKLMKILGLHELFLCHRYVKKKHIEYSSNFL